MRRVHPDFRVAMKLLEKGQAGKALPLAEAMIKSDDVEDRFDGFMCHAIIFEEGGADIEVDLVRSMNSYRQASVLSPGHLTFMSLARLALKRKRFSEALKFLDESASYELSPELILGYGQYFEEREPTDPERAKQHFFRAALHGRFAGFFGYSRVARATGQHLRALGMDVIRVLIGWLIWLAIGARARFQF